MIAQESIKNSAFDLFKRLQTNLLLSRHTIGIDSIGAMIDAPNIHFEIAGHNFLLNPKGHAGYVDIDGFSLRYCIYEAQKNNLDGTFALICFLYDNRYWLVGIGPDMKAKTKLILYKNQHI